MAWFFHLIFIYHYLIQRVVCRNWIHDNYCTEIDKDNFHNPTDIHKSKKYSSSFQFLFFSVGNFVVVHEHEQHDVVIVMFSGRLSLIYSLLAGLSRAAWDTEEDQTL